MKKPTNDATFLKYRRLTPPRQLVDFVYSKILGRYTPDVKVPQDVLKQILEEFYAQAGNANISLDE